eukprot:TRINITY_DN22467_c0_g1_i1.p1 TRINITY_DN22467_c0_g1~~TRINITY_DN22467_c0_g1_i1.p1  ORF type:complete len:763 (-),score=140.38 TRINITY_DN22467_c0_g1_i1:239-2527(-)
MSSGGSCSCCLHGLGALLRRPPQPVLAEPALGLQHPVQNVQLQSEGLLRSSPAASTGSGKSLQPPVTADVRHGGVSEPVDRSSGTCSVYANAVRDGTGTVAAADIPSLQTAPRGPHGVAGESSPTEPVSAPVALPASAAVPSATASIEAVPQQASLLGPPLPSELQPAASRVDLVAVVSQPKATDFPPVVRAGAATVPPCASLLEAQVPARQQTTVGVAKKPALVANALAAAAVKASSVKDIAAAKPRPAPKTAGQVGPTRQARKPLVAEALVAAAATAASARDIAAESKGLAFDDSEADLPPLLPLPPLPLAVAPEMTPPSLPVTVSSSWEMPSPASLPKLRVSTTPAPSPVEDGGAKRWPTGPLRSSTDEKLWSGFGEFSSAKGQFCESATSATTAATTSTNSRNDVSPPRTLVDTSSYFPWEPVTDQADDCEIDLAKLCNAFRSLEQSSVPRNSATPPAENSAAMSWRPEGGSAAFAGHARAASESASFSARATSTSLLASSERQSLDLSQTQPPPSSNKAAFVTPRGVGGTSLGRAYGSPSPVFPCGADEYPNPTTQWSPATPTLPFRCPESAAPQSEDQRKKIEMWFQRVVARPPRSGGDLIPSDSGGQDIRTNVADASNCLPASVSGIPPLLPRDVGTANGGGRNQPEQVDQHAVAPSASPAISDMRLKPDAGSSTKASKAIGGSAATALRLEVELSGDTLGTLCVNPGDNVEVVCTTFVSEHRLRDVFKAPLVGHVELMVHMAKEHGTVDIIDLL